MAFPQELKQMRRWVNYRLIPDETGEKPKKMPINPVTGKSAKSNDSSTWTDYQTAIDAVEQYGFTGIGFMFTKEDGFVGVDIDHCYDPETGTFNEVATAILAKQKTYAEFSPSGDGVHLWFRGEKPAGASKNTETGVEMYDSVRYFTVTEKTLLDATPTIQQAEPDTLQWIHATYIEKQKKPKEKKKKAKKTRSSEKLTDEEIIERASSAGNGEAFSTLWAGNWKDSYPSQSEADLALCMKLAFWSGKDREQMDRMFRQSGLFREKWDEKHHASGSTYGEETLDKAIENTDEVYSPRSKSPIFEYEGQYFRQKGDAVYPITNFLVQPVEMIVSDEETQLTADFVTTRDETFRLTLMTTDFANTQRFKTLLNGKTIALAYFGGDGDLELFKFYLSELDWPMKTGVKAVGIYEHNGKQVFVSTKQTVDADGKPVEDIVQLTKYASIRSDILDADILPVDLVKPLCRDLLTYTEPQKAVPILAWTAGCFLKDYLNRAGKKYPHLFLIGEAGSGKSTTMERVILPVFSTSRVSASTQVTAFTLMKESASSALIPQPLDEFKPSKMDKLRINALYNHFRDSYDGHKGERGRADQSVVYYDLRAPLVVAGEESAEETAIRDRGIELLFSKKDIRKPECRQVFNRICRSETAIRNLGRTLLQVALKTEPEIVKAWYEEGVGKFLPDMDNRIINNLACCYAGLKLAEALCAEYRFAWDDVFPYSFDACVRYMEMAAKDYMLDGGTHNQSIIEQTFEIMARMQLDPRTDYTLSEDGNTLYIRLTQVYDKYTKYRKDYAILGEVLPYQQFKKQLLHSDLLIQSNAQKRIGPNSVKCWIIDFVALSARCDVSGFITTEIEPLK